ncbi:MAB_1171c family putative transporter [Streptomyces lancefieldiae]|uniref:MAB_1171c family putative transporter n=1 Tax=Streptomyces lancefieldiae TaxID=3075520 RepID=A0ABU3AYE1_9ACTN|nr:MAB_1171c family putative transporter [Streptomyces sp. DSM 40712]MDT0615199.1 MAB_1171c family putative transporter [Streptomyces sp. DSM 40712]
MSDLIIAVMLWAVALWRAPSLWNSRKQRSLELAFLGLAAAMTLEIPQAAGWVDSLTGLRSTGYLLKHLFGVVSAASVLEFVIAVVKPEGLLQRTRRGLEVGCLTLMVIAFALAPSDGRVPDDTLTVHTVSGWALLHVAVFTLYIGAAMTVTALLFAHAARHASSRWVRAGHSFLSLGGVIGVLYAVQRILHLADVAGGGLTEADVQNAAAVSQALKEAAITAISVGSCLSPASLAATAVSERRALKQTEPLWQALVAAVPSARLAIADTRRSTRFLLNRRLTEISDATLTLREYVPADIQERALLVAQRVGYPPKAHSAVVEAAWLKTAVLLKPTAEPCRGRHPRSGGDGLSPAAELRWIRQVSAAYAGCPHVAAFATAEAATLREEDRNQIP